MLQKIKNNRPQAGFTLVELLIVIVVIAILAAIAITAFAGAQAQARDTQRKADVDQVQQALELYYADKGNYPAATVVTGTPVDDGTFTGLGKEALNEPQDEGGGNSFLAAAVDADADDAYGYVVTTVAGADCSTDVTTCQSYTLTYWHEADGAVKIVEDVGGE